MHVGKTPSLFLCKQAAQFHILDFYCVGRGKVFNNHQRRPAGIVLSGLSFCIVLLRGSIGVGVHLGSGGGGGGQDFNLPG